MIVNKLLVNLLIIPVSNSVSRNCVTSLFRGLSNLAEQITNQCLLIGITNDLLMITETTVMLFDSLIYCEAYTFVREDLSVIVTAQRTFT